MDSPIFSLLTFNSYFRVSLKRKHQAPEEVLKQFDGRATKAESKGVCDE